MKHIFYIIITALTVYSCDDCSPLKLSANSLTFDKQGGNREITSVQSWLMDGNITVNSVLYSINSRYTDSLQNFAYRGDSECPLSVYYDNLREIAKVESLWFSIYKINEKTVIITVFPNDSGKERQFYFVAGAACHEEKITVTQTAE